MRQRLLAFAFAALISTAAACGTDYVATESSSQAEPLRVMSFNVLCSFCDRSFDPWQDRLEYFADLFARYDPDLIGLQELSPPPLAIGDEVEALRSRAPGHAAVTYVPQSGIAYPDATILYRESRFTLLEQGEYWLSPTPEVPLSTGFARVQLPRLVVWARFHDKLRDRNFFFATTHFDNNAPSQELSAPLLQTRTAAFVNEPVIVVGDFNARPNSTAYGILTTDASRGIVFQNAYDLAQSNRIVTNQNPVPAFDAGNRIDHIFLAGRDVQWTVPEWSVDLTVYGPRNRYPSDHFAIFAIVDFRP